MKVTGFFGGDSQVGTTCIALAVAEWLANQGRKTLLLQVSGNGGDDLPRSDTVSQTLDYLGAALRCNQLTREELGRAMHRQGNLQILAGGGDTYGASRFPLDTVQQMLALVKADGLDHVLLDGGYRLDRRLGLSALESSQETFFLVSADPKSLFRFGATDRQILRPMGMDVSLLLAQDGKRLFSMGAREMETWTGRPVAGALPFAPRLNRDRRWRKAVEQLAEKVDGSGGIAQRRVFLSGLCQRPRLPKFASRRDD